MGSTCRRLRLQALAVYFGWGLARPRGPGAGTWAWESVCRTADRARAAIEEVGVDHFFGPVFVFSVSWQLVFSANSLVPGTG